MRDLRKFYIGGEWVAPSGAKTLDVINPATEEPFATIALGTEGDVDRAVKAAQAAFDGYAALSREERVALFERIIEHYMARFQELAAIISEEMGAPMKLALEAQAASGVGHLQTTLAILKEFAFAERRNGYELMREPIGVVAMITPWNWPANQIMCKVAPALAVGCTMVLKPSEIAPISGHIIAEILDAAGVPKGVFNLIDGLGPEVGAAMSSHREVDMVSFTGSACAGIEVARNAAPTVKRVAQELGGKSANIILPNADFDRAVTIGVKGMMSNTGQSCNAPSRMLVPEAAMERAMKIASDAAQKIRIGDPKDLETQMGPLSSEAQWNKVQRLIEKGIEDGAHLACGGPGRPDGLNRGYYAKPTVFGRVTNDMTIAREEIFGPVLSILPYKDEEDAIRIANDTDYGLAGYVYAGDIDDARRVGARIRAGQVHLNGAGANFNAPFGGYKQSGNGREWGEFGLEEFLETKAVLRPAG